MEKKIFFRNQISTQRSGFNKSHNLSENLNIFSENIDYLQKILAKLLNIEFGGNFCQYTQEHHGYGEGSDLYTIIKYNGRDILIKIGTGNFNTQVFNTGNIEELKQFYKNTIPLFVINQHHSYISKEANMILQNFSAKEYLNKYAEIIVPKGGEAYYHTIEGRDSSPIDFKNIRILHYEEAINNSRIALLHKSFPNGQFNKMIDKIKFFKKIGYDNFYNLINRNNKYYDEFEKKIYDTLQNILGNKLSTETSKEEKYQLIYNLIQSFDTKKSIFINIINNDN